MPLSTQELIAALDTPISIPIVPFVNLEIDYEGHRKNIDYLMDNNHLEGGRPRVICLAGTSLIHHIGLDDQVRLMEETARNMAGRCGVLIAGIPPNPISDAGEVVEAQSRLTNRPDAFLLMPVTGVCDPEGIYQTFMAFAEKYGSAHGARFLYYMRQSDQISVAARLVNESPHFVAVKVGTSEADVPPLVSAVKKENGAVIWGIGDRATGAARLGTKGHTSGINVVFAKASDEINNAHRRGDFARAAEVEQQISALEDIRFRNGRTYNYSAVVEALKLGGWNDVEGGEGGPFNPRVPPAVAAEVKQAIDGILSYH